MPGLPGAANSVPSNGARASFPARARPRAPLPSRRMFMDPCLATRSGLLATATPGDNLPALTVSELSHALKRTVEDRFGEVRVRGEISGFKRHASGHCYFTLKDQDACMDAVIWRTSAGQLRFRPEDGIAVGATGRLPPHPAR